MSISAPVLPLQRDCVSMLRTVLRIDAFTSGLMALVLLAAAGPLSALLNLPEVLLRGSGAALLPFSLGLIWLQRGVRPSHPGVWAVILLNALWVVASIALLLSARVSPNALGMSFVIAQVVIVLVFAQMQYIALRRLR